MIFWLSFKLANYTPYNIIVYPRAGILCVQKSEFLIEVYLHRVFITAARFAIFIDSHVHAVLAEHIYAITNTNVCKFAVWDHTFFYIDIANSFFIEKIGCVSNIAINKNHINIIKNLRFSCLH